MIILLNNKNWRFILNTLVKKGYKNYNHKEFDIKHVYEDCKRIISFKEDYKNLCFLSTNDKDKTFQLFTKYIDEKDKEFVKQLMNVN